MSDPAADPTVDLSAAKAALRARVLALRDALPAPWREQASARIVAMLEARPDFVRAGTVLLTLPFGAELDTRPLVASALARGKRVAVPRVDRASRALNLYRIRGEEGETIPGSWGIPEPDPARCEPVPCGSVDWALVPGVAFDRSGNRLGYGAGYFDRLLPRLRPSVVRVAAAFGVQVVVAVPRAPHDQGVHALVTEDGEVAIRIQ